MISIVLDMTAFELIPALVVALLGWMAFSCRISWVLLLAVAVELYREVVGGLA